MCQELNHEWLQNIKYILQLNGFGNRWNNPIVSQSKFKFYTGKRFNKSQLCSNCDTEPMESLEHVLFECNHFSMLRKIFSDNMKNKLGYLKCSNREKLKIILNVDNDVCNIICSHISNIVSEYEKTL